MRMLSGKDGGQIKGIGNVTAAPDIRPVLAGARRVRRCLVLTSIAMGACTVERTPHLYPINEVASKTGVLGGHIVGHGNLHGTMDISMPDGELLEGEYSIVPDGSVSVGFGSIFTTVYGAHGTASGVATANTFSFPAGGQGAASLYGNKRTTLQCEFVNSNMTGHGYGACKTSSGGIYRMLY